MKDIKEYLIDIDKWQPSLKVSNQYLYEEIKDFYGENNIPNDLIILYENNALYKILFEYINENLKTHDTEKLKKQLLKYYGDEIKEFKDYTGEDNIKSFYIVMNKDNKKLNIMDLRNHQGKTEKFFNLLNFFNYTYREWRKINNDICFFIEPIYSEDYTEKFNDVHKQAYHFTYKENVDKILKNGIRLREKNSSIRYPKRIYLWMGYKKLEKTKELEEFIKKILGEHITFDNVGIIKVDLSNVDYPIYKDTAMKEKNAIFVYNNIPANLCKEIKI